MVEYKFRVCDLYRDGKVKESDVTILRQWAEEQENLPPYTDEMLALFLICCLNSLKDAKRCARNYYSMRNGCKEVFANRDIKEAGVVRQRDIIQMAVSPMRTDENHVVFTAAFQDTSPWSYECLHATRLFMMAVESVIYENPPKGAIILFDCKGFSLMHLTRIHLSIYKKLIHYVQDGINVKIVGVHLINVNWIIDKFMKLLKPFIRPEVFEFIYFHTTDMDMDWFFDTYAPKRCVPLEYGGDAGSMEDLWDEMWAKLEEMHDRGYFKQEERIRYWNEEEDDEDDEEDDEDDDEEDDEDDRKEKKKTDS